MLAMSDFWTSVNLMGKNLYLTVVLVCIFQITKDTEYFLYTYLPYRIPLLLIHTHCLLFYWIVSLIDLE